MWQAEAETGLTLFAWPATQVGQSKLNLANLGYKTVHEFKKIQHMSSNVWLFFRAKLSTAHLKSLGYWNTHYFRILKNPVGPMDVPGHRVSLHL